MSPRLVILCYHRVFSGTRARHDYRPYFERGTAIGSDTFRAHAAAVARHFEVLDEAGALGWYGRPGRARRRPACWITFDDGYSDVLEVAAPVLRGLGLPASAFVTASAVEEPGYWLPADAWYAVVREASRAAGGDLPDYASLVDGPERRAYLRESRPEQRARLARLVRALGIEGLPRSRSHGTYMDAAAVAHLRRLGWSIGGHGRTHSILTSISPGRRRREIHGARASLERLGCAPTTFAYPDGAADAATQRAIQRLGWRAGLMLGERAATPEDSPFALPRFVPPDDPGWVQRVLLPVSRA